MDVHNCQPYWRKQIANIFQGLHFNHHGNKVKIFNDLQNNLLVTHGSTWVLNILTSCLWFRRVKTSWKTVVDLSRGNHTKCPKFQNLQYYCKFYPGYLVTGAPNGNFRENICSEDDLRSRIFGAFVVKFLACLLLLGFSNIYKMV